MKLEINKIYHNYIIRIVIFSLFLYKRIVRTPSAYKLAVNAFIKKRIPWKIDLIIDTGIKLDKDDEREILLNELLEGIESDYLSIITITFTTPLKETTMQIDLKDEKKYSEFLYN